MEIYTVMATSPGDAYITGSFSSLKKAREHVVANFGTRAKKNTSDLIGACLACVEQWTVFNTTIHICLTELDYLS